MITKFNKFLTETEMVDTILDKINKSGMHSISPLEKEYLNRTSKNKNTIDIEREINGKIISDEVGPYIIKFKPDETYFDKSISEIAGEVTISGDDDVYRGVIKLDEDKEYVSADFNSIIDLYKTIYDDYQNYIYEIDNFFDFCVYKLLYEND